MKSWLASSGPKRTELVPCLYGEVSTTTCMGTPPRIYRTHTVVAVPYATRDLGFPIARGAAMLWLMEAGTSGAHLIGFGTMRSQLRSPFSATRQEPSRLAVPHPMVWDPVR